MSDIQRRDFLKGTAALAAGVTAGLAANGRLVAGDPSFMNWVVTGGFQQVRPRPPGTL
jgi:hypothetical protein